MNTIRECGASIRGRREAMGLTLAELETLSGISERTLRRIEQGNEAVAVGSVVSVAQALGAVLNMRLEVDDGTSRSGSEDCAA